PHTSSNFSKACLIKMLSLPTRSSAASRAKAFAPSPKPISSSSPAPKKNRHSSASRRGSNSPTMKPCSAPSTKRRTAARKKSASDKPGGAGLHPELSTLCHPERSATECSEGVRVEGPENASVILADSGSSHQKASSRRPRLPIPPVLLQLLEQASIKGSSIT